MRGNRNGRHASCGGSGSIPACAGEPSLPSRSHCRRRVYPRVCGGTALCLPVIPKRSGLSPRVRGNHKRRAFAYRSSGSIPACAGEPQAAGFRLPFFGVYPRVCGGTATALSGIGFASGLSPRVRGNRAVDVVGRPLLGSIPACAGEPGVGGASGRGRWVYPRVCGGTTHPDVGRLSEWGLSPRVRGNRAARHRAGRVPGSIPACAGEPRSRRAQGSIATVYPRVCGGTRRSR